MTSCYSSCLTTLITLREKLGFTQDGNRHSVKAHYVWWVRYYPVFWYPDIFFFFFFFCPSCVLYLISWVIMCPQEWSVCYNSIYLYPHTLVLCSLHSMHPMQKQCRSNAGAMQEQKLHAYAVSWLVLCCGCAGSPATLTCPAPRQLRHTSPPLSSAPSLPASYK